MSTNGNCDAANPARSFSSSTNPVTAAGHMQLSNVSIVGQQSFAFPNFIGTTAALLTLRRFLPQPAPLEPLSIIDGTQSIGAARFDVQRVKPAFLFCSAYKWLLGPYGLAFLYADPAHQRGMPLEHHSYNRAGAEGASSTSGYSDNFLLGARRYDFGERSNFITLPIQKIALRQLLKWGPSNIQAALTPLVTAIDRRAAGLGLIAPRPEISGSHFTGFRFPAGIPPTVPGALKAANVFVSLRGETLRVSPYLYNTVSDVDRLFDVLASVICK